MATTQKTSEFYCACRNGDVDTVKKMLPKLKANDIDRIESNGSTALHAASYYGHANIVRLLLQQGANTIIRNKYEKTAKEEASTDEVRALFESTINMKGGNEDDDDDPPKSDLIQLYPNKDGMDKSELATRILKARLSTYRVHQYTISASSNIEHLENKLRKLCKENDAEKDLVIANRFFDEYRQSGDFTHMLRLYDTDTPFYKMIHDDETFTIETYKHLIQYDRYTFQGLTYRCAQLSSNDLELYQWASHHYKSLLEIRKLIATSYNKKVALGYGKLHSDNSLTCLFEFRFPERCFTTICMEEFSIYQEEKEVLIMPGSFFEVTEIRTEENDITIISLKNITLQKNVLSPLL